MRLIDADALEPYYRLMQDNETGIKMMALQDGVVDQQPAVDAVPVIRCKDCAYYRPYSDGKYDCDNMLGMADAYEDGFCSRAERKEE